MNATKYSEKKNMETSCCSIVELRQYTLWPGKRDVLIDLFEREFIETQEKVGIKVIGQFRDLDNPDRFVWLRGFEDMSARAQALSRFYGGPVWKAHREEANATMIDSDNVLLLHPANLSSGFSLENSIRLPLNANKIPMGLFIANIDYLDMTADDEFVDFFDQMLKPELVKAGAEIPGYFVTENSPNTFPTLPIREGEQVFVWFAGFTDKRAYENYLTALFRSPEWHEMNSARSSGHLIRPPEVLRLTPTKRSLLHS